MLSQNGSNATTVYESDVTPTLDSIARFVGCRRREQGERKNKVLDSN
jgi:hypothetical protein